MSYTAFLENKLIQLKPSGLKHIPALNNKLFPFQQDIVKWALLRGKAAIFAGTGLGKTAMQLEWAHRVNEATGRKILIVAPLAVTNQTIHEADKFGIPGIVYHKAYHRDIYPQNKIIITNYERLDQFNVDDFGGVVLDESSIIKNFDGKTKQQILDLFKDTPYKLACTATPAPNDFMELGNHAEFLGIMSRSEMLSMYFVHDGGETQKWRLKGHAEDDFWRWVAGWGAVVTKPSDLGYDDGDFLLPPLNYHEKMVSIPIENYQGQYLFPMPANTLQERIIARRESVGVRVQACADLVNEKGGTWLIWCHLNEESKQLGKLINGAVEVTGSDSIEKKIRSLDGFTEGSISILVSKSSICGFGLNFQHCHQMAFVGLSDSWEQFYQAIRRCWRFGQTQPVDVYLFSAETEGNTLANIKRKEEDAERMTQEMITHVKDFVKAEVTGLARKENIYKQEFIEKEEYSLVLGDCVDCMSDIHDDSIHYSIFSPPFASLYTYSDSERDMGNCKTHTEFYDHFQFCIQELYRVLMPGRLLSFHCMNLPTSKSHQGYIGIVDFRGELIKMFQDAGFIYHSEVCIWKDPVIAMQRTKALGLLHKQLKKDSCMSRQGIPDYLVTMRKPGENPERVAHTDESFPVSLWQRYASPIWMDINPSDTLQHRSAREHKDEKHICPLQLQVIERAVDLWTNPKDVVLSPFAGIGSEGYVSIKAGRHFYGIELKESYFNQAKLNLDAAVTEYNQQFLFKL